MIIGELQRAMNVISANQENRCGTVVSCIRRQHEALRCVDLSPRRANVVSVHGRLRIARPSREASILP